MRLTTKQKRLINEIADRAAERNVEGVDAPTVTATLVKWHTKVSEINFEVLRCSDDFDFWHDVIGVKRHLEREIEYSRLAVMFVPRCNRKSIGN